jgi:16S rRNA (uracil1498-N3)-methyltransferase
MHRVFFTDPTVDGSRVVVNDASRRHLADSLRVRVGERFLATNGRGIEWLLEIELLDRRELVARVVEERSRPAGPGRGLTLAIAPPKGGRMETAIEKTVEIGVGRVVPLRTERSVVLGRDDSSRGERWRRVAASATAQSGRFRVPEIAPVRTLTDAVREARAGRILLLHPGPEAAPLPAAMRNVRPGDPVALFVGPEGGFSETELESARRARADVVTLGENRLRTETAAIVAVTLALAAIRGQSEEAERSEGGRAG